MMTSELFLETRVFTRPSLWRDKSPAFEEASVGDSLLTREDL